MGNAPANGNSQSQKLTAEIKKTWDKLTPEEIGYQASNPTKFYEAVKTRYSINRDEAEKTVKKLDAECAASCGATAGKDAETGSAPLPKTANA